MIIPLSEQHESFLRDESRLSGQASDISFPHTADDVKAVVNQCLAAKKAITVQGARTGICGGAVPRGGHIMNLSEMNQPLNLSVDNDGIFYLTVQPGYLLSALRQDLRSRRFQWPSLDGVDRAAADAFSRAAEQFWPPDPSELTASIGGIASTNGRGSGAFKYGSAAGHIAAIEIVAGDGRKHELKKGDESMDIILGGEGMYGVITSLSLRLYPAPKALWGICFFFTDESQAAEFIDQAAAAGLPALAALDFLDAASLAIAADLKKVAAKLREIPETPADSKAAVYIELHADAESEAEEAAGQLMEMAEECGGDPDSSWALSGGDIEKLRLFRHAVPEAANTLLDQIRIDFPVATKLGGDLTLPGLSFAESLGRYRNDVHNLGFKSVVFGHAADNHLHVNLLPRNDNERRQALALMGEWLDDSRRSGGLLFREHGVGKVKRELFLNHEDPQRIAVLREIKARLDPSGLWNPGNML